MNLAKMTLAYQKPGYIYFIIISRIRIWKPVNQSQMFHIFNWKIEFYSPEMVVGNGWCCLFGFLFEISFRCERELNAKPRVRTNPMAVLRLLGMVMALGRLLLQKGTTKVQSCQYCLKSKLFFKKGDDVSDFKKALSKKVTTKLLFYNFIKHETQEDFSFLFNKNQSNIWRPWNSSSF